MTSLLQDQFLQLCRLGRVEELQTLINRSSIQQQWSWNAGLQFACQGGHLPIVQYMIEKGAKDWNWGLFGACRGGHLPLVELMIEEGADEWNRGFVGACLGGHLPIVHLMIEEGADEWNQGLEAACEGNHLSIIHIMIEKGADNWGMGLRGACYGRHLSVVHFMIEKGATEFGWFYYLHDVESVKLYWFYRELAKNPQARMGLLQQQTRLIEVIQEFQTIQILMVKQAKLPKELIRLIFTFL